MAGVSNDEHGTVTVEHVLASARALATALDDLDHAAAQQLNVGRSDLRILDALARHDTALTASALAHQVRLSRPALSAALIRLEQRHLVTRTPDSRDRRSVHIALTSHAQTQLHTIFGDVRSATRTVLSNFDPTQLNTLHTYTVQLTTAIIDTTNQHLQP